MTTYIIDDFDRSTNESNNKFYEDMILVLSIRKSQMIIIKPNKGRRGGACVDDAIIFSP